jgi:hypothetical protein
MEMTKNLLSQRQEVPISLEPKDSSYGKGWKLSLALLSRFVEVNGDVEPTNELIYETFKDYYVTMTHESIAVHFGYVIRDWVGYQLTN